MYRILTGDILAFARHYKGPRFHAVLCDPPYHLTSIVKRFGAPNAAPAQYGRDGAFARVSTGFMGQTWDGGDVAFRPDTWAAIAELVYPGGHLLAFGGDRTHHRLMCAIEDAGWEIRTCVYWLFGSGFPKSLSVQGQLRKTYPPDARCACVRHLTGTDAGSQDGYPSVPHSRDAQPRTVGDNVQDGPPSQDGAPSHSHGGQHVDVRASEQAGISPDEDNDHLSNGSSPCRVAEPRNYQSNGSIPSDTPENKSRASHSANHKTVSDRCDIEHLASGSVSSSCQSPSSMDTNIPRCGTCGKWVVPDWTGYGTALKPAAEIIVIARLPVEGTVAQNVLKWGTGALNIDGCRVDAERREFSSTRKRRGGIMNATEEMREPWSESRGRWPANVIHDGSDEVVAVFPETTSGRLGVGHGSGNAFGVGNTDKRPRRIDSEYGNDSGSAARFFKECPPVPAGRWPANVAHDGSEEVLAGFPSARSSGKFNAVDHHDGKAVQGVTSFGGKGVPASMYADSGSAARFFKECPPDEDGQKRGKRPGGFAGIGADKGDPIPCGPMYGDSGSAARFSYTAKADTGEREAGLLGHIPCAQYVKLDIVHDPDDGTGLTTLRHYALDEEGQPVRDKDGEIVWHDCRRNLHPTIKPLSLLHWLATLILPPPLDEPRRILIPFAGVGSEMIGAMQAGWDEIVGVELHRMYTAIAKARLDYYAALGVQLSLDLGTE